MRREPLFHAHVEPGPFPLFDCRMIRSVFLLLPPPQAFGDNRVNEDPPLEI